MYVKSPGAGSISPLDYHRFNAGFKKLKSSVKPRRTAAHNHHGTGAVCLFPVEGNVFQIFRFFVDVNLVAHDKFYLRMPGIDGFFYKDRSYLLTVYRNFFLVESLTDF